MESCSISPLRAGALLPAPRINRAIKARPLPQPFGGEGNTHPRIGKPGNGPVASNTALPNRKAGTRARGPFGKRPNGGRFGGLSIS